MSPHAEHVISSLVGSGKRQLGQTSASGVLGKRMSVTGEESEEGIEFGKRESLSLLPSPLRGEGPGVRGYNVETLIAAALASNSLLKNTCSTI